MRRKKTYERESHDRWLVSYADFITLLFAFFVVMFATSQSDKNNAKVVSDSVRDALEHGQMSTAIANVMKRGKKGPEPDRLHAKPIEMEAAARAHPLRPDLVRSLEILKRKLEAELNSGKMQVELQGRGLVISLREAAFFSSGNDAVNPASYPILEKVAAVVADLPNAVRLEGHTDSIPIHTPRFRSNWELSAARSIAMLELLKERFGIPRERMAIAGYAENSPVDSNQTDEGRGHNRRVDVVVLSQTALEREPAPAIKR